MPTKVKPNPNEKIRTYHCRPQACYPDASALTYLEVAPLLVSLPPPLTCLRESKTGSNPERLTPTRCQEILRRVPRSHHPSFGTSDARQRECWRWRGPSVTNILSPNASRISCLFKSTWNSSPFAPGVVNKRFDGDQRAFGRQGVVAAIRMRCRFFSRFRSWRIMPIVLVCLPTKLRTRLRRSFHPSCSSGAAKAFCAPSIRTILAAS